MSDQDRAAREAELYEAVKAADLAVHKASQAPDKDNGDPDYAAWWRGIAAAHIVLRDAYDAALTSGLWPTDSLMWTALMEGQWHNGQEAKRAKHEADLSADQAQRRPVAQSASAS